MSADGKRAKLAQPPLETPSFKTMGLVEQLPDGVGSDSGFAKLSKSVVQRLLAFGCWEPIVAVVFLAYGLLVGLLGFEGSGETWLNDGARYLNNGAMVRDWIDSGRWFDPINFAKENYVQFPAHSVPYHPPGYAVMLGIWFKIFGMSYFTGRAFIAVCLGMSLIAFRQIIIELEGSRFTAYLVPLILGSIPQIVIWSRSCMSEMPGMVFILWGSVFFLKSIRTTSRGRQTALVTSAFIFALIAFWCRATTAGVLPCWYLYLIKAKGVREPFKFGYCLPAITYLFAGFFWSKFASQYSKNEIRESLSQRLFNCITYDNLSVWILNLPSMVTWIVLVSASAGLIYGTFNKRTRSQEWSFWTIWIASLYVFQVLLNLHFEARYFIYCLPGIIGLASTFVEKIGSQPYGKRISTAIILTIIVLNLTAAQNFYKGLTGYEPVALLIGQRQETGNVMITSYADADLIFRLRCQPSVLELHRTILRGDRVFAIRNPNYSKKASQMLVESTQDVYDLLRKGRVRFVITEGRSDDGRWITNEDEVKICHQAMVSNPSEYELLAVSKIFHGSIQRPIHVWRFKGQLLEGPSTLPIVIPTADLSLN